MAKIILVQNGSPAQKAGLKIGDEILTLNGSKPTDVLDIEFAMAEPNVELTLYRQGEEIGVSYHKGAFEPLGFECDDSLELVARHCKNRCKFCFVDQLPRGLRKTLYVKDDDYRMSMTTGCYVTLTNVSDEDISRILRLHISPLYISVHATDDEVRRFLLTNDNAGGILDKMRLFAAHGIRMHTQIVMCKGINDGKVLERTLNDLYSLYPAVQSVSVIPVGLTGHRQRLYALEEIDPETAKNTISLVEGKNEEFGVEGGFCWCSDEMYIIAGLPVKDVSYYGDLVQIENGVGLVAEFLDDAERALEDIPDGTKVDDEYILVTGEAFSKTLSSVAEKISEKCGAKLEVKKIYNDFFGRSITVSGLLTGGDISAQLGNAAVGKTVILSSKTLKEFSDKFLDDMTVEELEDKLSAKVIFCQDAEHLVHIIVGGRGEE